MEVKTKVAECIRLERQKGIYVTECHFYSHLAVTH